MTWFSIGIFAILLAIGMWRVYAHSREKGWKRWIWMVLPMAGVVIGILLGLIL
jgi:hypothetical protein